MSPLGPIHEAHPPSAQSMAGHEHGLRFVNDEGRCLACLASIRELERDQGRRERDEARSALLKATSEVPRLLAELEETRAELHALDPDNHPSPGAEE